MEVELTPLNRRKIIITRERFLRVFLNHLRKKYSTHIQAAINPAAAFPRVQRIATTFQHFFEMQSFSFPVKIFPMKLSSRKLHSTIEFCGAKGGSNSFHILGISQSRSKKIPTLSSPCVQFFYQRFHAEPVRSASLIEFSDWKYA
jgi:hypothetical protein